MKRKILLFFVMAPFVSAVYGQKTQQIRAYAITGAQKGQSNWTEVRLIDIITGEEVQSVYQSKSKVDVLNARTGNPVAKKQLANDNAQSPGRIDALPGVNTKAAPLPGVKLTTPVNLIDPQVLLPQNTMVNTITITNINTNVNTNINTIVKDNVNKTITAKRIVYVNSLIQYDQPFATSSAAMAYDKKHERLYYTPMGIAQLRYIDLKTNQVFYFEDETFGVLKGSHDIPNQITRMVFASDGNGYALTNDANHLIRFTTGNKPQITDLGALTDDAGNAVNSIHNAGSFGGDMIADTRKNLYLVTANRVVFKISLDNRLATYLGTIKGLPKGFTTNGAIVEEGSKVIVSSSGSTEGYYRFDLGTLQAEKVSTGATVFNASDLANGNLAFEKKKKEKKQKDVLPAIPVVKEDIVSAENDTKAKPQNIIQEKIPKAAISVYPNPVLNGYVQLSFSDLPAGKYQVQFMDLSGRIIKVKEVTVNNKVQVEEFSLPAMTAKGNYVMKVVGERNKVSISNKIVVQ